MPEDGRRKPTGQGYNFGGPKIRKMTKRLREMQADPEVARRQFGMKKEEE